MNYIGRNIIILGFVLIVIGLLMILGHKLGFSKLPGDIFIKKGSVTFFFPIVSCLILSLILSLILNLFRR